MKKTLFILFALSFIQLSSAKNLDSTFQQANDHYSKKDYQKSIELYEAIISAEGNSPELLYNLGNAYFRTGKLGKAILNYEKALKLSPTDEDLNFNLKVASARITDRIEALPRMFFLSWIDKAANILTLDGWAYLIYVFLIFTLILAYLFLFTKQSAHQKKFFYSAVFFLCALIFSILLSAHLNHLQSDFSFGVITESVVTAKSSPDNSSSDVFLIHEGLKVELLDRVEDWRKIKLPDGKVGWITQNEIGEID